MDHFYKMEHLNKLKTRKEELIENKLVYEREIKKLENDILTFENHYCFDVLLKDLETISYELRKILAQRENNGIDSPTSGYYK